jgi:hypothetical protein
MTAWTKIAIDRVPSILDEDVKHDTMLVDRPPEVMRLTVDADKHVIKAQLSQGRGRTGEIKDYPTLVASQWIFGRFRPSRTRAPAPLSIFG